MSSRSRLKTCTKRSGNGPISNVRDRRTNEDESKWERLKEEVEERIKTRMRTRKVKAKVRERIT